jgi:hypothetical protein
VAQAIQAQLGEEGVKALEGAQDGAPDNPQAPRPGPRGGLRLEQTRFHENWFTRTIYVLHVILPRTNDLYQLTNRQIHHDLAFGELTAPPEQDKPPAKLPGGIELPQIVEKPPPLGEVIGVSSAFIAVMLAIACCWFVTKDY